ncbi:MAG: hypothetical protein ACRCX2_01250 [Paraclostridium sp.]
MARRFNRKKKIKHSISGKYKQRGDIMMGDVKIGFDDRWFFSPRMSSKRVSCDWRFIKNVFNKNKVMNFGYGVYRYRKYVRVLYPELA